MKCTRNFESSSILRRWPWCSTGRRWSRCAASTPVEFRWAYSIDLVSSNVSVKLTSLPIVRKQVQPLTPDEMTRLLAATSQCGFSPEIEERVRVFILLQRWSGLACLDAATLAKNLLRDDDNLTQVHRAKTDTEVFIPLPPATEKPT